MRELAPFKPYLTGSVLNGNAGKYADIDLQLFTDDVKAVELYFIDRDIPYKAAQTRHWRDGSRSPCRLHGDDDGIEIDIVVLTPTICECR